MKGILFKPWKIKFIAEHPDMELQTRRVIKPQPIEVFNEGNHYEAHWFDKENTHHFCNDLIAHARYQVGEVVYIKEAWAYAEGGKILYKVSESELSHWEETIIGEWRSPRYLKAADARYFIEITKVKPQRVQEIIYEDILAEGWDVKSSQPFTNRTAGEDAYDWFRNLWNSINPKYPFESNPWVFPYGFKVVEGGAHA